VQEFSVYRKGNLTYGEIMFVMECILDNMRGTSEKEAQGQVINGLESPSFTTLLSIASRLVETMRKKGLIGSAEEAYVLHGDR
jgi:AmiR/NasT family two-component response regulator